MKYELPQLPYSYDALEPFIDGLTMEIHHSKHHLAYINNLNSALEMHGDLQEMPLKELLSSLAQVPEEVQSAVRNHGGGHFNHSLFWEIMKPQGDGEQKGMCPEPAEGELRQAIEKKFLTFSSFKDLFSKTAASRFGSGWAWLSVDGDGSLVVHSSANQDCPLLEGLTPILCLDVWEHAYYLKYQNKRTEYIEN